MRKILKASLVILPSALALYFFVILVNPPTSIQQSRIMKFGNETEALDSLCYLTLNGSWEKKTSEPVTTSDPAVQLL